jgi:Nodulin-like
VGGLPRAQVLKHTLTFGAFQKPLAWSKMKLASAPARYFSRWSALAASFVISVLCGLGYAFGLYSDTLQSKLGYSQRTLDLVASFGKHYEEMKVQAHFSSWFNLPLP